VALKSCLAIACAAGVLSALAATSARADDAGRLPEDPAAGARSTAQWREHMAAEEHERRLYYDRDRIKEHRAVVKFLVATRARYDRAKTKAAVLAIQKRLPPAVEGVRRRITAIDHWGTNSNLLGDYDVMLKALSDGYPAARVAALAGDRAPLAALQADLDARTKHIKDWLAEAAASRDE
jgi:hypothetical protein